MAYWQRTFDFYNLTPEQLQTVRKELIVAQDFICAVCKKDLSNQTCYLDHDHHTGEIRGILCMPCNRFRVARNTLDTSLEVVRYLANPPARALLPDILTKVTGR